MDGVLLLAHGSRAKETARTMEAIAEQTRRILPGKLIQTAYMQFGEINIEKGLSMLMEQGVTHIKIVPYFLFDGIHIKEDIPCELEQFRQKYPHMELTMGKTLGTDERLAQIIAEQIEER